ncbi:MAG: DNA primase [bacterium]
MEDLILNIKKTINYGDFFGKYLKLKRVGSTYMSICPFHADSQPSLSVDLERGLWYCFGCNKGGDVFNFVMEMENCSFKEALYYLADILNIPLQDNQNLERLKVKIDFELYEKILSFYSNVLNKTEVGQRARKYLESRKVGSEVWKKFSLGYCPKNIKNLLTFCQKKGISIESLVKVGLVYKKGEDYQEILSGRIVIPIFSHNSKILGFAGRTIEDEQPKYINTIGLNKSSTLYGINLAKSYIKSTGNVFLVEGYFDVWALHSIGIQNVLGLMGTSITNNQIQLIKRYCSEVILTLDSDKAGQISTFNQLVKLVSENLVVKVVIIQEAKDPSELLSIDSQKLIENLNNIKSDIDYLTQCYLSTIDIYERQKFLEKFIVLFLQSVKKEIIREEYIKKFSKESSLPYTYLRRLIKSKIVSDISLQQRIDLEIYFAIFCFVNFDIFEKYYTSEYLKVQRDYFEKDKAYILFKYLEECVSKGIQPAQKIIHDNNLTEELKMVVKNTIKLDSKERELYFLELYNNLRKKYLVKDLKEYIKKGNYEKAKEIEEELRKLSRNK